MNEIERIKLRIEHLEKKGVQNAALIAKWRRKLRNLEESRS